MKGIKQKVKINNLFLEIYNAYISGKLSQYI